MAHFVRTQPDATWKRGYLTLGSDLRAIDQKTADALNGDEGGSWSPSTPIVIGGAGVGVCGLWTMGGGARVRTVGTSLSRIVFGKLTTDDAFLIDPGHAGYNRVLLTYFSHGRSDTPKYAFLESTLATIRTDLAGTYVTSPLRVHDRSIVTDVTILFVVGTAHANVPEYLPRFRIARVSATGVVESLRASDATTDADGFQFFAPRPSTGALWYAGGGAQQFVYTCNQKNVVDLENYHYILELQDERGADAYAPTNGNVFLSATALCTACRVLGQRH